MRKVGDGITERLKPDMVPATPENMLAYFRSVNATFQAEWGGYGDVIQRVRNRLQQIKNAAPSIFEDLEGYNRLFVERETEGWYLDEIAAEATIAELALAEERPWQAVACGMRIGELLTELRMKELWEPAALAGLKQRQTLDEHRASAIRAKQADAKANKSLWQAEANAIWAAHPGLSHSAVGKLVEAKLARRGILAKWGTIRRAIEKPVITA